VSPGAWGPYAGPQPISPADALEFARAVSEAAEDGWTLIGVYRTAQEVGNALAGEYHVQFVGHLASTPPTFHPDLGTAAREALAACRRAREQRERDRAAAGHQRASAADPEALGL
jgi:hypothetical protein